MEEISVLQRGNQNVYAGWTVAVISLVSANYLWATTYEQIVAISTLPFAVVIISHITLRLCLLVGEVQHVDKVCSGIYWKLLERTLSFNAFFYITAPVIFVITYSYPARDLCEIWRDVGPIPICLSFFSAIIILTITRAELCLSWEDHAMKLMNGLDYGSGMAHSYFHGYLRIILPAQGGQSHGLSHRINLFMRAEQIQEDAFPIKKLIVLIPSSGNLFPVLSDEPSQVGVDPDISYAERLQDHLRDRAGTKDRVYRGGAYRIRFNMDGKISILYAVAEGATPVKTFREASLAGSPEAEHLRQHKVDIISNFYLTLKKLITDDPELRHLVDLLYYDDEKGGVDVVALLKYHLLAAQQSIY